MGPALQKGLRDALRASEAIRGLIGDPPRVYDEVPDKPTFPYVTIGRDDLLDASDSCHEVGEAFPVVDVWTRPPAARLAGKRIAAAVVEAIAPHPEHAPAGSGLTVEGYAVVSLVWRSTRHLPDPDGRTQHAVVTFRALLRPTL